MEICHFAENIHIFLSLTPFDLLKYWPKVTKIAHHKVHWHVFSLTKFGDSSSYRSWDSREGQNLPPPLSRARDSQTLSSAGVNPRPDRGGWCTPPLRFFADSEKRRCVAPPGFRVPYGANLRNFWLKKSTRSGQVTELWRHKRNNLQQFY